MKSSELGFSAVQNSYSRHQQQGAILLLCLVFLTVLTLVATAGMEAAIVEQQAARRMQDHQLALQSAEAALTVAEDWLDTLVSAPPGSTDGSTLVWQYDVLDPDLDDNVPWWQDAARQQSWWQNNARIAAVMQGVVAPPRYIIEALEAVSPELEQQGYRKVVYRISARGSGRSNASAATVQALQIRYYE